MTPKKHLKKKHGYLESLIRGASISPLKRMGNKTISRARARAYQKREGVQNKAVMFFGVHKSKHPKRRK